MPVKGKGKGKSKPDSKVGEGQEPLTPKRGRVENRIEQTKARLLECLTEHDGLIVISCRAAGVSTHTYYTYLDNDPVFAEKVKEIRDKGNDDLENIIFNLARHAESEKVQLDAAKTILGARAKDRGYGVERREQQVSGELHGTQTHTVEVIRAVFPSNGTESNDAAPLPESWEANTGLSEPS